MDLDNKKFLVMGAGGLLGSEVVISLLNSNAEVVAVDLSLDALSMKLENAGIEIEQSKLILARLDITNETEIKAFFGIQNHLDGAVNCAYPRNSSYGAHFFDVTLQSFNENLALNLGSSFIFMQQCAAYFAQQKKSFSLVNISSIYGVTAPSFSIYEDTSMTVPVEYAAVKSSLLHLNKYVAAYINNSNFRINSVSPGGLLDGQPESFLMKYKEKTLGHGMLKSSDILGAIKFLLSDSSQFINGQNIVVDDGFTL